MALESQGIIMNHKKIQGIMRSHGMQTRVRRRNPYRSIMKKGPEDVSTPNILNREFTQGVPRKILCTDITYIKFFTRFVYLSVVKDVASGEIVAWYCDRSLHLPLVLNTLKQLDDDMYHGSLLHSDQGWHYTNTRYVNMVRDLGIQRSLSRRGNCIDNAPVESFFGHLKDELDISQCRSFEELCMCIDEYMNYYNTKRPQWDKQKMTPVQYRDHLISS